MSIENILVVVAAVKEKHGEGKPEEDIAGEMPCPICKVGTVQYEISSHRGHIWAKCVGGEGCVSFMQ